MMKDSSSYIVCTRTYFLLSRSPGKVKNPGNYKIDSLIFLTSLNEIVAIIHLNKNRQVKNLFEMFTVNICLC